MHPREIHSTPLAVVGIDRLGRNAAEVMTTIRELRDREIVLRSLREGIDTSNATGRMVAGVLASLAELEVELGRERRAAAREARRARGQAIGRPKALDASKAALARRMHSSGEPVSTIANTLAVSRATVYRVLAEADETDGNQGQAGLMTSKSVHTQIIGAAGEVLITYKLLKFGIDSARMTTDAGVDFVNVYTRQSGSGDDSGQVELGCGARWR